MSLVNKYPCIHDVLVCWGEGGGGPFKNKSVASIKFLFGFDSSWDDLTLIPVGN